MLPRFPQPIRLRRTLSVQALLCLFKENKFSTVTGNLLHFTAPVSPQAEVVKSI